MRRLDKPPNNAPTAVARVGCGASGLRYVKLKCNLEIDGTAGFAKPRMPVRFGSWPPTKHLSREGGRAGNSESLFWRCRRARKTYWNAICVARQHLEPLKKYLLIASKRPAQVPAGSSPAPRSPPQAGNADPPPSLRILCSASGSPRVADAIVRADVLPPPLPVPSSAYPR